MDIDEFLETEINAEKKEDAEKKPVSTEIPGEAKDNVKNFFELWKKLKMQNSSGMISSIWNSMKQGTSWRRN